MIDTSFHAKSSYTVGAELEVRIVKQDTLEVAPLSQKIRDTLPKEYRDYVHQELLESMVEIVTPICTTPQETSQKIQEIANVIKDVAKNFDATIAALGTHAFEERIRDEITKEKRYLDALQEYQYVVRKFLICGFHIHIGLPDTQSALKAYNLTINYLPLFLALSASSPFYDGEYTGLESFRTKIFEMLPRSGIPEYFDSYAEYERLLKVLERSKTIASIKDLWWDIRLHPDFGTVELRVCDAMNDIDRIELLIALFQALALYAQKTPLTKLHRQIQKQNKWNAVRHGMSGKYITPKETKTLRDIGKELVLAMRSEGVFTSLQTDNYVSRLLELMEKKSIARELVDIYEKTKSLKEVEKKGLMR